MKVTVSTYRRLLRAQQVADLRDRDWSIDAIAREVGVTDRQVWRDLRDLPQLTKEAGGGLPS